MSRFPQHDMETASEAAKPLLAEAKVIFGFVPNLQQVMAVSPALLEGYLTAMRIFSRSSLTPQEQQVVLLTASFENRCHYCTAGHSMLARLSGVPEAVITAIRDGLPVPDVKLEALRTFTSRMVERRGWVDEAEIQDLLNHGYIDATILDVILGIATKTMSNYVNHVAHTELDDVIKPLAWSHPGERVLAQ